MITKNEEQDRFYVDMGFRLKQIRQVKQVSQEELASALSVVKQTIQKYESGEIKMSPEIIRSCAEVFGVSVGYLYGEEHSSQKFTRVSLMIATEVMQLPSDDIRKSVYALLKSFNTTSVQDNEMTGL